MTRTHLADCTFPFIDCLEFDAGLRASDALDELAFLQLECERLGPRDTTPPLRCYSTNALPTAAKRLLTRFAQLVCPLAATQIR